MTRTTQHISYFSLVATLGLLIFSGQPAKAQVHQAAVGTRPNLWVGGEFSDFDPDYNFFRLYGAGIYADYYFTRKIGVEAEGRLLDFTTAAGQTQKSLLAGPTYTAYRRGKLLVNAKVLLGGVKIIYPVDIGYGSYFAFAPGGNVEYQIAPRIRLRAEYEYEFLPGAPGFVGQPSNGLTPNGFSIGASYRIF
jgi:opacity protein-like surface antigen